MRKDNPSSYRTEVLPPSEVTKQGEGHCHYHGEYHRAQGEVTAVSAGSRNSESLSCGQAPRAHVQSALQLPSEEQTLQWS